MEKKLIKQIEHKPVYVVCVNLRRYCVEALGVFTSRKRAKEFILKEADDHLRKNYTIKELLIDYDFW